MLMGGTEYLDSIRDGRRVYVGGELVEDVTTHPAFCSAARTIAMIYDRKRAPQNRDVMAFDEDGETLLDLFPPPARHRHHRLREPSAPSSSDTRRTN
jgi:4-hydroxyphenylacetate 3-monooxygenase